MSGNLATALAEFQGSGFAIPRLRTVTVETKKGGQYTFDYAPHELIVAAVRKPLADVGLAVSQPLATTEDGKPGLRTILLHASGESIESIFPLPTSDGMTAQELGSAITYIRRYALSAILGLSTEDDDDGNRASGNTVSNRQDRQPKANIAPKAPTHEATTDGGLIGTVEVGKPPADFELREEPDGMALSFKLMDGRKGFAVVAKGAIALSLYALKDEVVGERVTAWGRMGTESFEKGKQTITYNVLDLDRIAGAGFELPLHEPSQEAADEPVQTPEAPAGEREYAQPVPVESADATSPGPAPAELCGSSSPYGDDARCTLLPEHKGPHKNLEAVFPTTWTD